jgi:hypothetical protein
MGDTRAGALSRVWGCRRAWFNTPLQTVGVSSIVEWDLWSLLCMYILYVVFVKKIAVGNTPATCGGV